MTRTRKCLLTLAAALTMFAWCVQRPKFFAYTARPLGYEAVIHTKVQSGQSASLLVVNGRFPGSGATRSRGIALCIYDNNRPVVTFAIGRNLAPFYKW